MTHQEQAQAMSRMRHALLAFQAAQVAYLSAHRRLKSRPPEEVDAFWDGPGHQLEATLRTSAKEVEAAFPAFCAAGLVASPSERHLITEAKRSLEQGAG